MITDAQTAAKIVSEKNKYAQSQIRQGANPVITERSACDTDWPRTIDPLQPQNNLGVHWLSLAFCIHPLNWRRKEKLVENERKRAAEAVRPMDLYSIHIYYVYGSAMSEPVWPSGKALGW